jgi:hypothetical protein
MAAGCLACFGVATRHAAGQSGYYNLDAGRPNRVEDASATSLYALDFQLAPLRVERLAGGTIRYRSEPKLSYGVLPFTEVEVRVPLIRVEPPRASGAKPVMGASSVGLGVLHALNLETTRVPAIAFAAEWLVPAGGLAPPHASYVVKAMATKTTSLIRLHANGGVGTYSVRASAAAPADSLVCSNDPFSQFRILPEGQKPCSTGPPIIIDLPCNVTSTEGVTPHAMCMGAAPDSAAPAAPLTRGRRWFGALGFDHAFALRSTLVSADVVAERFLGLYPLTDWTAELGVRKQLSPRFLLDAGAARKFAGSILSSSATLGVTYEMATRPLWR